MADKPVTFNGSRVTFPVGFSGQSARFETGFGSDAAGFDADFGQVGKVPASEVYDGPYEITPEVVAQEIPTAEKFLEENMTVKAIPFYDVGNTSGGRTVYIGKEL